jgi:hypothetical protein
MPLDAGIGIGFRSSAPPPDEKDGIGASFGPDAITTKPWLATRLRRLEQQPRIRARPLLPHATIGSRFAPVKGERSAGR